MALLLSFPLLSQENFVSGQIVALSGDTLQGTIDYRNWKKNPRSIVFSEKEGGLQTFSPLDIRAFLVEKEIYVGTMVEREISSTKLDQLSDNSTPELVPDTIFLQTLISGPKSLYYYKDQQNKDHFYLFRKGTFELLIHKKYLKAADMKRSVAINPKYIGQLTTYLQDCPSVVTNMDLLAYEQASLTKLFVSYYECSPTTFDFFRPKDKLNIRLSLMAGAFRASVNFKGGFPAYLLETDFSSYTNFSAGVSIDFYAPRDYQKWSVSNEFLYSTYQIDGEYRFGDINAEDYELANMTFGYSYAKVNQLLRYRYPLSGISGKLFVSAHAGISNGFMVNEEINSIKFTSVFGNTVTEFPEFPIFAKEAVRRYEQGLIGGLGITYNNRLSLEYRLERGNGTSVYRDATNYTTRHFVFVKYHF
jgi:hypothetical protein